MLVKDVTMALEKLAPVELAEEWDNVGLLIGRPDRQLTGVLLSLDLTPETVEEAVNLKANLIVTHHPPIFKPLKHLRLDHPAGMLWEKMIKNDLSVYTLHTNYDRAADGLNEYLAKLLHLIKPTPLQEGEPYLKLVVFLPKGYESVVLEALTKAGAGWIGNYSHCTFQTGGIGTFLPREGTNPFLGEPGRLERVKEVRLETILPARLKNKVIRSLLAVHPYEEVAFDLYPVVQSAGRVGLGRIGNLPAEVPWESFLSKCKEVFSAPHLKYGGRGCEKVKRIAVIGGSGGKYIKEARAAGAEVLITADLGYHDYLLARDLGLTLVDPGHHVLEKQGLVQIKEYLDREFDKDADRQIFLSHHQVEPYYFG